MEQIPNIRHLAAFAATVEHGSATNAAAALNLTQPALTQAIARLERQLECQLFERSTSGMRPTEPAQLLFPRVGRAIERIGSSRVTASQMRAFVALANAGSYASAAKLIGLSPASLHRSVSDLSLALGERLVERRGRHLVFTRKGEARVKRFGIALAEIRSGLDEVANWRGMAGGRIVVGAMPLSRARWLPRTILDFRARHPGIDVVIVEGSYTELSGPLRHGEIDVLLGALREAEHPDDLFQEQVFEDHPMIIMRHQHPLASSRKLTLKQLRSAEWILPSSSTPLYQYWAELFSDLDENPTQAIECGSVLTTRELLLETDMLTLLSRDQLRVEIEAGLLVARRPPTPVVRSIGITTRLDWIPTGLQANFIQTLKAVGSSLS